ncbi:aldehyde dehydrogenase [Acidipila sp. EB88]|uniref:aldehyde dehydrogenase family protein n=1 Tax=Acidipila sp. EB88 TaxID=2305226 RepID=UPI000F5FF9D7|nr:aldehyde dehydrogenase family protein [Acidipila sp. EB88]RRA47913.1 aldehyde dehydrogenase family protein [Acidipila sp. EB88]
MPTLPHVPAGRTAPLFASAADVREASTPRTIAEKLVDMRAAQRLWAATPIRSRLHILRCFRAELATGSRELAATVACAYPGSLRRTESDTLVAEILPLAECCRFLEREAAFILRTRREDASSRPFWLRSVDVEVERVPLGVVLIIGPGNYPLFLPGAQALQALAAGNAVLWKPAPSGVACAHALRVMLIASGLPPELLTILDPDPAAATAAIEAGVDKVFLTGSAATGEAVLHTLAHRAIPSVMELSGCDAVFVLQGADPARVVDALLFGLRLNGSATCMAPRRVLVDSAIADELAVALHTALAALPRVPVTPSTALLLLECLTDARVHGAQVLVDGSATPSHGHAPVPLGPTLLAGVAPSMRIAQTDLFAPVLSLLPFTTLREAASMHEHCPYALTAAIFGPESEARTLAQSLTAGTILLNDLIVATADPRVPFSGRKRSGFGATRGREGLLEMSAPRAIVRQRSKSRIPYQPTTAAHGALFAGYLQAVHAQGWRNRLAGFRAMGKALPGLKPPRA